MSFKMKSKPKKPNRQMNYVCRIDLERDMTVADIMAAVEKANGTYDRAKVVIDYDWDEIDTRIEVYTEESLESFNIRMYEYHEKLNDYEKWIAEHAKEIANYKANKKSETLKKTASIVETEHLKLQKQLDKLKKELAKYE